MVESIQHKLDRVRSPRVQITYDVEIGAAIEKKELAFVVGILADLSGMPENPLPSLKHRKFIEIDRDNINDVMKSIRPHLKLVVPNKLIAEEGHEIAIDLYFENIGDFNPMRVVEQVPDIHKMYESRSRLKDLMTKLDGNDVLEDLLTKAMTDAAAREALKTALADQLKAFETPQTATKAEAKPEVKPETPAPEGGA